MTLTRQVTLQRQPNPQRLDLDALLVSNPQYLCVWPYVYSTLKCGGRSIGKSSE